MTAPPETASARPDLLVACVGTATEVGKTWVGAAVLTELRRRSVNVAARKPAQSFDPTDDEPTDAQVLADAGGERADEVVPEARSYPMALAPPMAAARLHRPAPRLDELVAELRWPERCRLGWLETVGGVRSPIAVDADSGELCVRVDPDVVVLVGDASLGAIGAVRSGLDSLALAATPDRSLATRTVVLLNRFDRHDPTHVENASWLIDRLAQPVFTEVGAIADHLVAGLPAGPTPAVDRRPSTGTGSVA